MALDHPGEYEPEKLATYLQTAAMVGSRDVEKFKKDWHGDDVRELWQTVNANELPQGGDAWPLDYSGLLQDTGTLTQNAIIGKESTREFQPPSGPELVKLVGEFRARHPELNIHVSDEADPLPIDVQVGQFDFRVEKSQSAGETEYVVVAKPDTESSSLRHDILRCISESKDRARLATLLVLSPSFFYRVSHFTNALV